MANKAIDILTSHGIRPSAPRISIMEYLLSNRTHPTVDAIYSDLVVKMPTLSKTTIYSTLKLLEEHKTISELTIDKKTAHYDGIMDPHSHFLCKKCGRIIDVPLPAVKPDIFGDEFVVEEADVYYRGMCKQCKTL